MKKCIILSSAKILLSLNLINFYQIFYTIDIMCCHVARRSKEVSK